MDFRSLYFILASVVVLNAEEQDWTKKCNKCNCIWASGKKTANCADQNFSSIPNDLSSYIREIDFSNNPLNFLGKEEFLKANLSNIHKLKLQNCSLELIDEKTFNHLALLIELDLARNHLEKLHSNTFHDNIKLRVLILSDNKIKVLEDGLFNNLTFLQKISLDHNLITTITSNTFKDLPALIHINLGYNRIQRIEFDLKKGLARLNSLNVEGNPWICDCKLQEFRYSAIKNNLITTKTVCQNPSKLQGRAFQESVVFACLPKIIEPFSYSQIEASSANITFTCKVSGDPIPDVDWINGGHIIERDPRKNKQKYYTSKDTIDGYTWNNLTITNVNYRDRGDYKCIAKNPGGEDERNITLLVPLGTTGGGITGNISNNTYLIIGLSIGFIMVLLILLVVIFCFCKKSSHGLSSKRREHADSSEEYISMSGGQADIKKGLITDVNPITKPPRTTVPPSVVSGGTEVSDVKRNLLDNESVFDCDDESRSLDFDQPLLRKSQMTIDSDYRLNGHHYPPDLLPFPPRGVTQVSPAPSSTSTVADTTRLPPHHGPQSPLHSPIYDQLNLYRTLPYSRSHSPFVGPAPRVPRQGYVTIPRRPRQQSWSSEPPNVSELASVAEPLYDNLGLRTTADGGASALSLNKLDGAITTSTPRTNRMFPLSPTNCDPIAESHEASGGNVGMGTGSQTLPRNLNSTKLTPSRTQWAKANAEALRSPEKRNSTASLPPTDPQPGGKPTKVPPRPPPKPKKRLSTGPLFEDEGEDGTEV